MAARQTNPLWQVQADAGRQALQGYGPALQWLAQNAGLQIPQGAMGQMGQPMAQPPQQPMAQQPSANRFQGGGGGGGFGARPAQSPLQQFAAQGQPMASVQPVGGMGQQPMPQSPMPQAGLPNSALGIYGQNPADVYRLQQAEEDVDRMAGQRAKMLQYRLGQQGIGNSGTAAAALGQNENDALTQLANFRRQLAMGAGQEQERRMQMLLQAMGLGTGAGAQGQNVYGQQQQIRAQKGNWLDQLTQVAGAAAPFFIPGGGMR